MPTFDSICPLLSAGYGRVYDALTPPHCYSECAWFDEVHEMCSIRTIAQHLDLSSKTIDIECEDEE